MTTPRANTAHRGAGFSLGSARTPTPAPRGGFIAAWLLMALLAGSASAQPGVQRDSKRECAVCHLDWADAFERKGAVPLIDRPRTSQAAEPDTCLGCHDGAVADSRNTVWLEHGHRVGEKPTDKVTVPPDMPLIDGKLSCRTCHSAHAPGRGVPDFTNIVFVRVPKDGGELCAQCHVQNAAGPGKGSHPMGAMPFSLPDKLRREGARGGGAQNQNVTCQTCHMAHGPRAEHLLVMGTESSQLCLTCHEKLRPTMWHEGAEREHPPNPPLTTAAQKKSIKDMGTRTGPGDTMICLSCHKMHHGQSGRYMLAKPVEQSNLCISCHPDRAKVANSAHDMRKSRPTDKNLLGQTPDQAGVCGSCHSFHRYARKPTPNEHDPDGRCTTCHQVGKGGEQHVSFSHPTTLPASAIPKDHSLALHTTKGDPSSRSMRCSTCHDPHEIDHRKYLRAAGDELCSSCHAEKVASMAGKHDFSKSRDVRNGAGRTGAEAGKCGFCHAVHQTTGPSMWVATKDAPKGADGMCIECHRENGLAAGKPQTKLRHPTGAAARPSTRPTGSVLLFTETGHKSADGFVACGSCHDIHGNSEQSRAMLRPVQRTSDLCVSCHAQQGAMAGGKHDARAAKSWPVAGLAGKGDLCLSCHVAHSNDTTRGLWTAGYAAQHGASDGACVACHAPYATSDAPDKPPRGAMIHPTTAPASRALPLVSDASGDRMGCKTCHSPHASMGQAKLLRVSPGAKTHEVCYACHAETRALERSMHAADVMAQDRSNEPACGPCHAVHATQTSQRQRLWSYKLDPAGRSTEEKICLGCHDGTTAPRTQMPSHPVEPLRTVNLGATTRPLRVDPAAGLECSACHAPHGSRSDERALPISLRRATKPMLKPRTAQDQCATCHGPDAARLWLYYHRPVKRAAARTLLQPGPQ